MSAHEPLFDAPEPTDHAYQARQLNAIHPAPAFDALEFRYRDPVFVRLQSALSREITTLESLRRLYDETERLTSCHDLHILSCVDEYVERVERAQLRVNQRAAELGGGL